jgi:MoaA/NifB/PqqE/SkfB family radical SAM enzyme
MLTERCNLTCGHCGCWRQPGPELDEPTAAAYAGEMIRAGVLAVSFCGGEVLLRADLGDLLRRFERAGMVTRVTTNGALVPDRLDDLRHATTLKVSVDGPAAVHDRLRGAGSHAAALAAVEAARSTGLEVQLNTVLGAPLLPHLRDHLRDARHLGVSATFQPPEDRGEGLADLSPEPANLRLAISHLLALRGAGDPVVGNSPGTLALLARWPDPPALDCHAGRRFCRVLADGHVVACDRPQAPHALPAETPSGFIAGVQRLQRAGPCAGCWRNNTLEINRLLGARTDALGAVRRWL